MPGQTPFYGFPFPVGTDQMSQGDDTLKDFASGLDGLLGAVHTALLTKGTGTPGFNSQTWYPVNMNTVTLTLPAPALCLITAGTDAAGLTDTGSVHHRINADLPSQCIWYEGNGDRSEFRSLTLMALPAGSITLTPYMQNFKNNATGFSVYATTWGVWALGTVPELTP